MLYKLIFYAASFEVGSISLLFAQSHSLALIGSYLVLHGCGSVFLALALTRIIPLQYRQPRAWVLTYLFFFNFFMPLVGLLCVTAGLLLGFWLPRKVKDDFGTIDNPLYTMHRDQVGTGFRGGQIRAQVGNLHTPVDQRLKALMAVQDSPARTTGTLLRTLLADPADDVRLLAYGILDGKEKNITQRIQQTRQLLLNDHDADERFARLKLIAELYWELIYQDLVQGDMRSFSAGQVRKYGEEALSLREDDAGLWFLLMRLELYSGNVAAAEHALEQAQRGYFAPERLLPYLAELRFLQRRFRTVLALFKDLAEQPGLPAIARCRAYWLRDTSQSRDRRVIEKGSAL